MANGFSSDHEGEVPVTPTDAEITLKKLLDKQLSTTGRLEQVDFQEATESMHYVGYGSSGLASLSDFLKNELAHKELIHKARGLRTALHEKGYSKEKMEEMCQSYSCIENNKPGSCERGIKRKRYGADPLFVTHAELEELDITTLQKKYSTHELKNDRQEGFGRHAKELEASLLRGKERLQAIAHLSGGGSSCRKPLIKNMEHGKLDIGMTPQDRVRLSGNKETSRTACEVFLKRAPEVLDLHTYLDHRSNNPESPLANLDSSEIKDSGQSEPCIVNNEEGRVSSKGLLEVTEQEIICNRLSEEEIRELPGGKFANYLPGNPSHVLYIKNLAADVTQADLAALFLRFQSSGGQQLMFRLMQQGRMKGQAFVTFPDKDTSCRAFQLINGYKLKGRPMVIEFGRVNSHG